MTSVTFLWTDYPTGYYHTHSLSGKDMYSNGLPAQGSSSTSCPHECRLSETFSVQLHTDKLVDRVQFMQKVFIHNKLKAKAACIFAWNLEMKFKEAVSRQLFEFWSWQTSESVGNVRGSCDCFRCISRQITVIKTLLLLLLKNNSLY